MLPGPVQIKVLIGNKYNGKLTNGKVGKCKSLFSARVSYLLVLVHISAAWCVKAEKTFNNPC